MSKSTIMSKRITKFSFVGTLACTFMVSSIGLVNADGHGVYGPFPITEKAITAQKRILYHMVGKLLGNYNTMHLKNLPQKVILEIQQMLQRRKC